uniref:Uncharacterized protein n=1 Tax=Catharus ustulatus TaxID=91951 RepID=A0A8C3TQ68_CATUS
MQARPLGEHSVAFNPSFESLGQGRSLGLAGCVRTACGGSKAVRAVCSQTFFFPTVDGWMCCPKGWRFFQASCYYLSPDTMSWAGSEQNCTGMGSQLVVINSKAEQVRAQG